MIAFIDEGRDFAAAPRNRIATTAGVGQRSVLVDCGGEMVTLVSRAEWG